MRAVYEDEDIFWEDWKKEVTIYDVGDTFDEQIVVYTGFYHHADGTIRDYPAPTENTE